MIKRLLPAAALCLSLLLPAAFATDALAQTKPGGGFGKKVTVAQVLESERPGTPVQLQGRIADAIMDNYYQFKDDSGQIQIKVLKSVVWPGQVDQYTNVEISGFLIMDGDIPTVEVHNIRRM
ncbi:MAG: NirD/YgiW/YdeI family stress tolerance protein [Rhodospirillales bacterium]|nr:NirD/YgiW/YdeI family stress tolerance protein [Rhodospirillales bacterium]